MLRWLIVALYLLATSALAADGAKFRAIGFSADAKFFAFEQYGVQDGSGFAYSDVFILDIVSDKWVDGTPIKTLLEDETGSVAAVRAKAKAISNAYLAKAKIVADPEILASNPFTEVVPNRAKLTFHDQYNSMGIFGDPSALTTWTLAIKDVKLPMPADCETDMNIVGYQLTLTNTKSLKSDVLHLDQTIPKSRFCPVGYDLEAVVQPAGGSSENQLIAIIGVSSRGFEGADRRFIAVPFTYN
jgi:predicted secreted protein